MSGEKKENPPSRPKLSARTPEQTKLSRARALLSQLNENLNITYVFGEEDHSIANEIKDIELQLKDIKDISTEQEKHALNAIKIRYGMIKSILNAFDKISNSPNYHLFQTDYSDIIAKDFTPEKWFEIYQKYPEVRQELQSTYNMLSSIYPDLVRKFEAPVAAPATTVGERNAAKKHLKEFISKYEQTYPQEDVIDKIVERFYIYLRNTEGIPASEIPSVIDNVLSYGYRQERNNILLAIQEEFGLPQAQESRVDPTPVIAAAPAEQAPVAASGTSDEERTKVIEHLKKIILEVEKENDSIFSPEIINKFINNFYEYLSKKSEMPASQIAALPVKEVKNMYNYRRLGYNVIEENVSREEITKIAQQRLEKIISEIELEKGSAFPKSKIQEIVINFYTELTTNQYLTPSTLTTLDKNFLKTLYLNKRDLILSKTAPLEKTAKMDIFPEASPKPDHSDVFITRATDFLSKWENVTEAEILKNSEDPNNKKNALAFCKEMLAIHRDNLFSQTTSEFREVFKKFHDEYYTLAIIQASESLASEQAPYFLAKKYTAEWNEKYFKKPENILANLDDALKVIQNVKHYIKETEPVGMKNDLEYCRQQREKISKMILRRNALLEVLDKKLEETPDDKSLAKARDEFHKLPSEVKWLEIYKKYIEGKPDPYKKIDISPEKKQELDVFAKKLKSELNIPALVTIIDAGIDLLKGAVAKGKHGLQQMDSRRETKQQELKSREVAQQTSSSNPASTEITKAPTTFPTEMRRSRH